MDFRIVDTFTDSRARLAILPEFLPCFTNLQALPTPSSRPSSLLIQPSFIVVSVRIRSARRLFLGW
jgi:hypothetical protein